MKRDKKSFIRISMIVIIVLLIFGIPTLIIQKDNSFSGKLQFDIDMSGLTPLYAQQHETWTGVRFIATAAKLINTNIEAFMRAVNSAVSITDSVTGEWDGDYTHAATGNSFTYKLGLNQNYTAANSVDGTTKTYNHGYMLCQNSTVVYQIFFDSSTDPGSEDGTLLMYKPSLFADYFTHSTAANVIVEFTLSGTAGSRTEVMSWTGGPMFDGGTVTDARVILSEGDSGNEINFVGVAKLNSNHCSGGVPLDYYAIAFIAKTASPNYSTGKWGLAENAIPTSDNICSNPNPTTYGTFNSTDADGIVEEGVAASDIPAGYPTADEVDTLFTGISSNTDLAMGDIDGLSAGICFSGAIACP